MAFGRPPTTNPFKPTPPDRGSFPLDHYGECKDWMRKYMECLEKNNRAIEPCRGVSKQYLLCRMEKGLMAKDDLHNLGFQGDEDQVSNTTQSTNI